MQTPRRVLVDTVDFRGIFRFPRLLGSITAAMQPPRLLIGLFMIVLLICLGNLWDGLLGAPVPPGGLEVAEQNAADVANTNSLYRNFLNRFVAKDDLPANWETANLSASRVIALGTSGYRKSRAESAKNESVNLKIQDDAFQKELAVIERNRPMGMFEASTKQVTKGVRTIIAGVSVLDAREVFSGFADLFIDLPSGLWRHSRLFAIIFGVVFLVVISIGGGALSRMAACEFAAGEKLRAREAIDFAMARAASLIGAVALPLILATVLGGLILIMGVFANLPILDIVLSLLYGVALLLGLFLAFLVLGYAVGFPLLLPAVAVEGCDSSDAFTRAYAYVLARPLHLVGYVTVILIGAAIGYVVVAGVAVLALNATAWLFGMTIFSNNAAVAAAGNFELFDLSQNTPQHFGESFHTEWSAAIIAAWQTLVVGLVAAYVLSYIFDAFTRTYLLLRSSADGQDTHEIWRPALIAGTAVPRPDPIVSSAAPPQDEFVASRTDSFVAAFMRGIFAMRLGGRRSYRAVAPPPPETSNEDVFGPELISEHERRIAGVPPSSDQD